LASRRLLGATAPTERGFLTTVPRKRR